MNRAGRHLNGERLADISSAVVAVYADHHGRGPTKARTYAHEGVLTCLLEDTLTRAERTLVANGRHGTLLRLRGELQETMQERLAAVVEGLAERRVRALVGGTQLEPDLTSLVFVLDGAGPRAV